MKPKVYLDYAAATPLDPSVLQAMQPYLGENFYNPSSLYRGAREVKQDVESARAKIANVLGANPAEIIFTSGSTESVNLAIMGIAGLHWGKKIVASAIEHHALLGCLEVLDKKGVPTALVGVNAKGITKIDELEKAIDDDTVLVSIAYANNEIGTIQPLRKISQIITKVREDRQNRGLDLQIYLHTDASQAAGYLSLAVESLGVDLLTLSGSKIYGPKGSGILYVRRGIQLQPIIYGGGQEKGLRSGTENVSAVIGLAEALVLADKRRDEESQRLTEIRNQSIQKLIEIDGVELAGDANHRIPNNISVTVDGVSGEDLVLYLDEAGFQVSTGAACTIGSAQPPHVLLAIGFNEPQANSSLRITFGRPTTQAEIDSFLVEFPKVVARLRQLAKK